MPWYSTCGSARRTPHWAMPDRFASRSTSRRGAGDVEVVDGVGANLDGREVGHHLVGDVGVGVGAETGAMSVVVRRDVVADPVAGDVGLELAQRGNRVGAGESADRHHRG